MNKEKTFEELQLKDDFMFGVIMRNPKFCKPFLEQILKVKISRIEYPKLQKTIDLSVDAKSVRLDIYVEDEEQTVYNIEMQTPGMKRLLDYIDGKAPEDAFTRELDAAVRAVRTNAKWRVDYMTLEMHYKEKYEQGLAQGRERNLLELVSKKLAKGKSISVIADELEQDEAAIGELMRKYQM